MPLSLVLIAWVAWNAPIPVVNTQSMGWAWTWRMARRCYSQPLRGSIPRDYCRGQEEKIRWVVIFPHTDSPLLLCTIAPVSRRHVCCLAGQLVAKCNALQYRSLMLLPLVLQMGKLWWNWNCFSVKEKWVCCGGRRWCNLLFWVQESDIHAINIDLESVVGAVDGLQQRDDANLVDWINRSSWDKDIVKLIPKTDWCWSQQYLRITMSLLLHHGNSQIAATDYLTECVSFFFPIHPAPFLLLALSLVLSSTDLPRWSCGWFDGNIIFKCDVGSFHEQLFMSANKLSNWLCCNSFVWCWKEESKFSLDRLTVSAWKDEEW